MLDIAPLGGEDLRIQVTGQRGASTALFTCRGKDHDLTFEQLLDLAESCTTMASFIEPTATTPTVPAESLGPGDASVFEVTLGDSRFWVSGATLATCVFAFARYVDAWFADADVEDCLRFDRVEGDRLQLMVGHRSLQDWALESSGLVGEVVEVGALA